MKNYSIPESNIETLEKKLTRIRNKAEKYGCQFVYNRTGEHFEEVRFTDENGRKVKETIKYIDIEVDGTAKVDGWEYVATLDYYSAGNIISGTGKVEVPERYYTCAPYCEHCKTARDRKSSYIVFNEETGEFKQVGRNCLRDFTGGLSAEAVAGFEQYLKSAEEASQFSGSGCFTSYYAVKDFMAIASETIRIYGYVKRGTEGMVPTVEIAEDLYRFSHGMRLGMMADFIRERYDDAVSKGFAPDRQEVSELVNTVRDWIVNNDQNDNYFHNLKVAGSVEDVDYSKLGLLVSAFPAYDRNLEYQAEKLRRERSFAEMAKKSEYLGNVGDKVSMEIAEIKVISSWETQWGTTTVYKFTGTNSQQVTWKTSKWVDDKCIGKRITGTIKELKEFRGAKQTELTRCKIA